MNRLISKVLRIVAPVCFSFGIAGQLGAQTGKVTGVSDGDTATVLVNKTEIRVRLAGIDAPEKGQPFGQNSKQWLSHQIFGKTVTIQGADTDRYGRLVGWIHCDGRDINRLSVLEGMAWWYRSYASRDLQLAENEASAKSHKKGLWSASELPIEPWEWRKRPSAGETGELTTSRPLSSGHRPQRTLLAVLVLVSISLVVGSVWLCTPVRVMVERNGRVLYDQRIRRGGAVRILGGQPPGDGRDCWLGDSSITSIGHLASIRVPWLGPVKVLGAVMVLETGGKIQKELTLDRTRPFRLRSEVTGEVSTVVVVRSR